MVNSEAAKTHTKDMSKLFYIYHQNVKDIIHSPNPSDTHILEVSSQIDKVLRGAENTSDPFIATLSRENNIKSFCSSFKDLSSMLKTTMRLNQQK